MWILYLQYDMLSVPVVLELKDGSNSLTNVDFTLEKLKPEVRCSQM